MCQCIPLKCKGKHRHNDYINKARELSFKSQMYHKHGACLVYRGKIISHGYNRMYAGSKSTQIYDKYSIYSIHAEVSAIKEFLRLCKRKGMNKRILKDSTLYVVRTGKKSMDYPTKMSKPCDNCYNFIKKHKIKKVYWSEDNYDI